MCSIADFSKNSPKESKLLAGTSTMIIQNWPPRRSKIVQMDRMYLEFVPVDENEHVRIVHPRNLHRNLILQPDLVDLLQKKVFALLKLEPEEKQFWVCGFYLVLLLVQEERVASLESLELFVCSGKFFIFWPRSPFSALTYWRKLSIMAWFFPQYTCI